MPDAARRPVSRVADLIAGATERTCLTEGAGSPGPGWSGW